MRTFFVRVWLLTSMMGILLVVQAQVRYELLLKGGHVINPESDIDARRDVAISQGKIAAVAADIPASKAQKVVDVSGLYFTPGLVAIHCHLYATSERPWAWDGVNSVF